MAPAEQPSDEHQVGITNAQEKNPDAVIADLTKRMILIARKLREGERDPGERLGLTIMLHAQIALDEAVEVAALVQDRGFKGATFAPKRQGSVAVYHTDNLGMTAEAFQDAATILLEELMQDYPALNFDVRKYFIHMPRL